jgi:ceramide glucosyltransferase
VSHACVETSAAQLIAHERRWSRTIRTIDPAGHLGSALTHPFAFALIVVLLSSEAAWSWALVLGAILARFVLKLQLNRALRQPDRNLGLLPIWDLALFAVFVTSFFSSRVVWRGFSFHVGNDGMLYPVQDE